MIGLVGGALVAGLLGSPHCVGMCGAFATASADRLTEGAAWHTGRLAAYTALGATVGAAGGALPLSGPVAGVFAGALLLWFSLRLAGLAPELPFKLAFPTRLASTLLARRGLAARAAFGALSALLPCGLLWTALAVAAAGGSAVYGAAAMAAFWLGTVPLLAGAARGLRLVASARPWTRRAIAAGVFAAGLWSIGNRAVMAMPAHGAEVEAPGCHVPQP